MAISDGTLRLSLTVRERVLSLRDDAVDIPLRHIVEGYAVADVLAEVRGTGSGAHVPGVLAIGVWRGDGANRPFADFVVIEQGGPGVVLVLKGSHYQRVVIGTARPEQFLAALDLTV